MVGKIRLAWTVLLVMAGLFLFCGCPSQGSDGEPGVNDGNSAQVAEDLQSQDKKAGATDPETGSPGDGSGEEGTEPENRDADTGVDDNAVPPSKLSGSDIRPATQKPLRPGDKIPVDFSFYKATFQDNASNMARLDFEFRANRGRMDNISAELVKDDAEEPVSAKLDLGICSIEIFPVCDPINLMALEGKDLEDITHTGYQINGSYQVHFFTPEGHLAAKFGITREAEFFQAPIEESPDGFGVLSRNRTDDFGAKRYQVYRKEHRTGNEVLFTVVYLGNSFSSQTVYSPEDIMLVYRFPEGRIEVYQGAY